MDFLPTNFHFVRPLWFLGCIPAILLFVALWMTRLNTSSWKKAISSPLLPHLLDKVEKKRHNWPLFLALIAWLLSCVSLAGPVWEKLPQPIRKKENALIIIQDLSLSFYAQDLSPNRLVRARHKLTDILKQRKEGTTALIVYSAEAHIVTPLTDDTKTIASMIPALSPQIMPNYGSNVASAVQMAVNLLKDSGISQGRILLLTDEVEKNDVRRIENILRGKNIPLLILGIGTNEGGPIPIDKGGFLKDNHGNIIVPRLNSHILRDLAARNNGQYSDIKFDDKDIEYLLAAEHFLPREEEYAQLDRNFDQWEETGYWFLLIVLPITLLAFRKGWILVFILMVSSFSGNNASAMSWQDLWLTHDQQAQKALKNDDPLKAADLFQSQDWKGVAAYKAGEYEDAVHSFVQNQNANSLYNSGNALAKAGKYEDAIKAYNTALQLNPKMDDARFNQKLVKKMLQQQKQQQQSQQQEQPQEKEQNQKPADQQQTQNDQNDSSKQQPQEHANDQQQQQSQQQQGQNQEQKGNQDQQHANQSDANQKQNQDGAKSQEPQEQQLTKENRKDEQKKSPEENKMASLSKPDEKESNEQQTEKQAQIVEDQMTEEEQQAMEQWLRQIPDNPGGLLQRKFEYESRMNGRKNAPRQGQKIW